MPGPCKAIVSARRHLVDAHRMRVATVDVGASTLLELHALAHGISPDEQLRERRVPFAITFAITHCVDRVASPV